MPLFSDFERDYLRQKDYILKNVDEKISVIITLKSLQNTPTLY